jgi:hypothetical protein
MNTPTAAAKIAGDQSGQGQPAIAYLRADPVLLEAQMREGAQEACEQATQGGLRLDQAAAIRACKSRQHDQAPGRCRQHPARVADPYRRGLDGVHGAPRAAR